MKVRTAKLSAKQIEDRLQALEEKFGMDSATFYKKYTHGETDDRRDFVRWAGLLNMRAASPVSDTVTA